MFEIDPLFTRTFLLALPLRDIVTVLQRDVQIPLHEIVWTVTRVLEEIFPDEEWDDLDQCLREMNKRRKSDFDRLERVDLDIVMSLAKASAHLLRQLFKEHNSALWERIQIFSGVFTLLGSSLMMAKRSTSIAVDLKEDQQEVRETIKLLEEALQILQNSLHRHVTLIEKKSDECYKELQGWTALLSLNLEDDEMQQFWQEKLRESLKYRIDQMTQEDVIKLFCSLDLQTCHRDISECLKAATYEAADHLLKNGTLGNQMAHLSSDLATSKMQSPEVGGLFSLLLKTCWPEDSTEKELSQDKKLEHILTWKPMAQYFKHFGAGSVGNACLPNGGLELLVSATSLVEHIALCLRSGEINVSTLRIVSKDRDRFLELYSLLPEVPEYIPLNEEAVAGSEASGNQRETADVEFLLEMRAEELEAFEKERDAVSTFIRMCSIIRSVDIDLQNIKKKLEMDLPSRKILEICHKRRHGDEPAMKFFDLSIKNKGMIQSLNDIHHSLLFRDFWQMCGQKAADFCRDEPGFNGTFTIDKVRERLWLPSFRKWRGLWERIINGEISLKDVDEKFHRFRDDPEALVREMKAALITFSHEDDIDTILRDRVDQIKQCHKLKECEDAAAMISYFKEAMELQGDFHLLDDFRDQMSEEFLRRQLGSISYETFQIARALESFSRPMIQCLRTVIECKEYIFWLREEVKGREEVKTLVDLAMMSTDESAIETDRVSCLHTTALGFAPFIFDLAHKHADFEQLMEICEGVWEEVERNDTLPEKLEDISGHLEWLKGIKDEHAMSSLKLAQAINERGIYFIGTLDNRISTRPCDKTNVNSVISLRLLPEKEIGQAREFNLEKLRELQSKLALISGKDSQGQEAIQNFGELLQGVVQLGQSYVNLCEIGDVSHLGWKEEFKCKSIMGKKIVDDIQSKSKEFDQRYKGCKEHINSLRKKYHELNFFTIQQLLFLRKELASLKHGSTMEYLSLQVYSLLEKVFPGIHRSLLQNVFLDAGILSPHFDHGSNGDTLRDTSQIASLSSLDGKDNSTTEVQIIEKFENLLKNLEKLSHSEPERLAVAALINNLEGSEIDLLVWCVQNMGDSEHDLVDELYERASGDPRFHKIVDQKAEPDAEILQSSQNSDCDQISVPGSSDDELSLPDEPNLDETKGGTFLSLEEMGVFLSRLAAQNGGSPETRAFPSYLKKGHPNLVLVSEEQIFAAVLNLYMEERAQSLPKSDEVLVCTSETTPEEVELLWRRALVSDGKKLHCLVNGDVLDYDVSQKVVDSLHTLMQDYSHPKNLALVVLCSSENEERAHIISCLEQYKVPMPRYPRPDELRRYLEKQLRVPEQRPGEYHEKPVIWSPAAQVGRAANLNVRVVSSENSGVGKSLVAQRLAEEVAALRNNRLVVETMDEEYEKPPLLRVTIPFHEKHSRAADVVGFFLPHALPSDLPLSRVFHLDRSSAVTPEFETLLFNLLILGELTDDCGRVWRRNSYDLYILEITHSTSMKPKESGACKFHELLPQVRCCLPEDTISYLRKGHEQGGISPSFDEEELLSDAVQRVWWYLHLFETNPKRIQKHCFNPQRKRKEPVECLETLIRNCGVPNPSWSELRNFVNFLNYQLRDCEESTFCEPLLTDDTLQGFKTFVVKFMIIMSEDFAMRSLTDKEDHAFEDSREETAKSYEEQDIVPFQLRRRWENSPHPYIFFNPDHVTMTFLGFQVDQDGNLLDPKTKEIIERNIISRPLRTGLHVQKVDLDNDFESYSKGDKIQLLCSVMGIECGYDPDESYELTGDNVKKILAIHMRFRCNIPVVIMGETGCGKTRLIRYLCGLQTEGEVAERRNMILMKIHGGTTYKDIERNVLHAETVADKNELSGKKMDTILFFDEANTTDALGMIKEIMVDRRCNGRPLRDNLKFVAACNPYRKHTKEMIHKLETAGLGYHITADETTERLGGIPLRHLVYRVHALPESMRSLVWDFGQLNAEVEELYTRQIVGKYVREGRLPGDENWVIAIAAVLTASQQFMRNKKDECSFVSLRDVKRAMEVMVWFYQHFQDFSDLMKEEQSENEEESSNESESESEEVSTNVSRTPSDSEDDQCGQEKTTTTIQDARQSLRDHVLEVNSIRNGEERPTVSQFICDSKETASVVGEPTQVFSRAVPLEMLDYADKRGREERPSVSKSMYEPNFSFALKETASAECEPSQVFSRANPPDILNFPEPFVVPLGEEIGDISDSIDPLTWSLILALGICYQARLTERKEFRGAVAKSFRPPCRLPGGAARIEREINRCQEALMEQLELGPNIACNEALRENVFMMVVCIELRIPLFVVGKPGSSKSLAKTVVADNMQGGRSKHGLFKRFKQIQLVSYQCSPQSTPEGILATFQQCSELQESKNEGNTSDTFASVVVLDEVGLAEDSPQMPLKTLHPLLEDDDQSDAFVIQTGKNFARVAFIGLSNWALDPAKMNRGIMLCRNEPDEDELVETARGICGSDKDIVTHIEPLINSLVCGYKELYDKQKELRKLKEGKKDEFFGLRDFYSLVKMIVSIAKNSKEKRPPNGKELEHAVKRNFSGLVDNKEDFKPVKILMENIVREEYLQDEDEFMEDGSLELIRESLNRDSVMGEGRYLLIMTENFAALPRVKQLLLEQDKEEPYVIFGSGFPKDQLFTQVCRNINRIKMCMETGRTVILLNLENLYESLYDVLNQYYVTFGGEKYVDLGLGNNRVKCRVHKNFRLIVIAAKDVVYNKFPIPLINRLEKHFLVMSSGLTIPQKEVTRKLKVWVDNFADIFQLPHQKPRTFSKGEAFIGYHEDTVPAIVLQVCAEVHNDGEFLSDEERESWEENVLRTCKERLLQCATPDSVTRLSSSRLRSQAKELWTTYFHEQEHSSLADFLEKVLGDVKVTDDEVAKVPLRAQISTHSRLLSKQDISTIAAAVQLPPNSVKCASLQQFQTEQQFLNCIGRDFWSMLGGRESLLIVQCDSGKQMLDLTACARHLLIEECKEMENVLSTGATDCSHIVMIVQVPRVAGGCREFVSVQGENWLSVHIDELCPPSEEIPPVEVLKDRSVSEIFESAITETGSNLTIGQVLRSCVQIAASKIEDDESTLGRATRRIELLLKLFSSRTKAEDLCDNRFEKVLAKRIHVLLQEKDKRALEEGKRWLEDVAKACTINENGTFKKALWRRFQSVVAPILAEVIAYVDRDGNLELAASKDTWMSKLWLNVLEDSSLATINYGMFMTREEDVNEVRSKVPVLKSGYRRHVFQSRFPFSWLLKERIDELYREARSIAANSLETVTECLRKFLDGSNVAQIVSDAISEGGEDSVARYLHDFAHMVNKPQDEAETEIVIKAIWAAAKEIRAPRQSAHGTLIIDFALVHVGHSRIRHRLHCLSLLLRAQPEIVHDLQNRFSLDEDEMTVDATALQIYLERMAPSAEDLKTSSQRQIWCDSIMSVKMPVDEMIGEIGTEGKERVGEKTQSMLIQCRSMWQRLSAVRMFIEHVYPSEGGVDILDVQHVLKLWKALADGTDFTKAKSLTILERVLHSCKEDVKQRLQDDDPKVFAKFLRSCNAFLMEIIKVFCLGDDVHNLDADVFEMLMRYVTGTQSTFETREFSLFPEFGTDSSPVERSFLLQQLLNSSGKLVKSHLERFLFEAQGLPSEVPHLLNVCLLAVQCMENSCDRTFATGVSLDLHLQIGTVNRFCQDALEILQKDLTTSDDEIEVKSLEAIAKARSSLSWAAQFIYLSCVSGDEKWHRDDTLGAMEFLLKTVQALCTSVHFSSPALFLLKQLVKRYGGHAISTVSQNPELAWIVPVELSRREDTEMNLDRFLVYGELYRGVRDAIARAILSDDTHELVVSLEALYEFPGHSTAKDIVLLLALYREITLPQRMSAQDQHFHHEKCATAIRDVLLNRRRMISQSMQHLVRDLLKNSQNSDFSFLVGQETQSETEKALPEILFHVTSVLRCIGFDELLNPLREIVLAPSEMLNSFLPTMPEDIFEETRLAMTEQNGQWYECGKGHPYFVGDCGRPNQQRDCPYCDSSVPIGGLKHHLVPNNKLARRDDRSNKGHILGTPKRIVGSERDLSPAMVSLLRFILHSAMLSGAQEQPKVVSQLISESDVQPHDVGGFLWAHLVNDVQNVSTSLERSVDEVVLMIHGVLAEIVYRATARGTDGVTKWSTKAERREWENRFSSVFVRPVCTNLEERLQNFYTLSINDKRLGSDPLMREIYEVDDPTPPRFPTDIHPGNPSFWKYRTRLTVEHFIRQFQDVRSNKDPCKILGKFLKQEHKLRAVRHLPEILALLRILTDRFYRRINRDEANKLRIREFLKKLSKDQKESVTKLFKSFRTAWDQARSQLSSQGRFTPSQEQCSKPIEMNSSVSVLLPDKAGPGVCCKALLFFLVNAHNEMVETYHAAFGSDGRTRTTSKIPLAEVSASQLVAYDSEKDLLPVMLANCTYSLEVGKEKKLQYNWETLQKQIVDKFIRGRPIVEFKLDDFVFHEDDCDISFVKLRNKIPQESIDGHIRNQILSELKELRDVSELLSTLEMAIGFLSTAGGDSETKVCDYLKEFLLLGDRKSNLKSKKAQQSCCLCHILDLWSTIAEARARFLFKNRQDPFEKVSDSFKEEMPKNTILLLSAALKRMDVDLFLSRVIEVISLLLVHEEERNREMGLSEYLSRVFDDSSDLDGIPEEVKVMHVIHACKLALDVRVRD
ncbi:E3 ubiquitin-protein ligase rnf213-alpha-like isoform X3 [Stylophora pistillata]|nr:E3 ubiquitin-protein ligase rnf213-alpha-like isoform X3 [Stylophora pistillata]